MLDGIAIGGHIVCGLGMYIGLLELLEAVGLVIIDIPDELLIAPIAAEVELEVLNSDVALCGCVVVDVDPLDCGEANTDGTV